MKRDKHYPKDIGASLALHPESHVGFRELLLVILFLLSSILFSLAAVWRKSATIDEFHHLPTGCLILKSWDFRMDCKSPPLARIWSALPSRFFKVDVPTEERWREFWSGWGPWAYGTEFFLKNTARYDTLLFLGRAMNALWLLPLGVMLFLWANSLYGRQAAWAALGMLCLCPTVLAHAPLITTDLGATACYFGAIYLYWLSRRAKAEYACLFGAGIALGLGLLTKFTLVLVPVIWAVLAAYCYFYEGRSDPLVAPASSTKQRMKRTVLRVGLPLAVALLVVNMGYGFKGTFRPLGEIQFKSSGFKALAQPFFKWLPAPLPYDFIVGLDDQKATSEIGEFPAFCMGEWSRNGWWYYYILAFFMKTPVSLSLLILWALLIRREKTSLEDPWSKLCIWTPVAMLFYVLSFSNRLNTGIRYFLPALPFLILFAGRVVPAALQKNRARAALALMVVWFVGSSLAGFPNYLAYFNELVGGPSQGYKYLLDSNLDWGQDLGGLKDYMDSHGIKRIKLAYFGHVWPDHYGISFTPLGPTPEPGDIAISANFLQGHPYVITYVPKNLIEIPFGYFGWLKKYKPVASIGHSIFIYHIDAPIP